MGRMFRILSDGPAPALPAGEPAPYVEVGGPDGLVTSWTAPAAVARQVVLPAAPVEVVAAPAEPEPEPEPREEPGFRPLSVAFHRFLPPGAPPVPAGVSPDLVTYHFPLHPVSAEYRAVRDEIARQYADDGPKVALFVSALPQSGATTVLLNLAASLAADQGRKVLVVEAGAAPAAARRLGAADAPGLAEVLALATPLAWAVQPTAVPNLHALAAGSGVLASDDLPKLLGQLRGWFDWVLVDGGAWDEASPAAALAPAADGVYLVSRQGDLDRPEFTGLRAAVAATGGAPKGYVTTRG